MKALETATIVLRKMGAIIKDTIKNPTRDSRIIITDSETIITPLPKPPKSNESK